jgi:hypothetical protein
VIDIGGSLNRTSFQSTIIQIANFGLKLAEDKPLAKATHYIIISIARGTGVEPWFEADRNHIF